MRTVDKNGIHIDQCDGCRGIFLDRGELDRLIDAENTWHGGSGGTQTAAASSGHQGSSHQQSSHTRSGATDGGLGAVVGEVLSQVRGQKHSSQDRYQHDRYYDDDRKYQKKRKESFLGDLFG